MGQTNNERGNHKISLRIRIRKPSLRTLPRDLFAGGKKLVRSVTHSRLRWHFLIAALVILAGTVYNMLLPYFEQDAYALDGRSNRLLPESSTAMAEKIDYKMLQGLFNFAPGDTQGSGDLLGKPNYASASLNQDPTKGMTVTDPTSKVSFTMTPQFALKGGKQSADRIVYPLADGSGWAVYTLQGDGVKEDIILNYAKDDKVSYSYKLGLGDSLSAKLEQDGSLGIYGNTLLSGDITAATSKDADMLQKARKQAPKNTVLFRIPAPVVVDEHGVAKGIAATYSLDGDKLTVTATGMKKGNYPLAIDPSVYVSSAQQFMQGNNETNVNFDVNNKQIKIGNATGAQFNSWNSTKSLADGVWGGQTVAAGGFAYQVGGTDSSGATSSVNWAQFNTSTGTIDSANPGSGACASWCTDSSYNLPDGRANFSLVAYNGFLYALGGTSANCTAANGTGTSGYCKTVYVAKIGATGEPQLWHPTDTNPANWTYWYRDTDLPAERAYTGAVAYNNNLYLLGGRTASGATTAASIAPITPTGKLGSWSSSSNTVPSGNAYGLSAGSYNGQLYVVGGSSSPTTAPTATAWYSKINTDGSINAWQQTASMAAGRTSGGSNISAVYGGYLYISGGCSAINASGYCTTIQSDTQVASINADGSLGSWDTVGGVSDTRLGHSLVAWRNKLYQVGGCSSQNTSTGACSTILTSSNYGSLNQDGDIASPISSAASGSGSCAAGTPYNCNLPASVGSVLNAAVVSNGYLYVMGGCTNNACSTVSTGIAYQAISSDGSLQKPAACSGSYTDSYCVSSTSLPTGLAASGVAVFGNRIYLVGGFSTGTNIYYATTNADGSLGSWSNVSLSSASSSAITTLSYSYAYARANPAAASTAPGNLYIIGGCTSASVTCSGYSAAVLKCNLAPSGAPSGCSTSGQLQIGSLPNSCGTGIGAMSGTVYAGYMYLIGGASSGCSNLPSVRYAKIDGSNNIVAVSGSSWQEGANQMATGRQLAAGFSYNGYLYAVGGYNASSGTANTVEFAKINVSDGSWGAWSASNATITGRWGLSVPVSNSFAYVVGGCTAGAAPTSCTARTTTNQTFRIYNNGSGAPAGFTTSANTYSTDAGRAGASAAVLNGYLYIAGGCTGSGAYCSTASSNVSYAPLDAYGNVGSWSSTTGALPAHRAWGKLVAAGGTLYYLGGQSDTASDYRSEVYYATPSSGNVSSWSTASNGLPNARASFGAAVWNNRLYVVGGLGTSGDCSDGDCPTVYVSPQLNNGGDITSVWSMSSPSFNVARSGLTAVAYANNLYVLGGYDGANYLSDTQYAKIDGSSGSVGSWSYSESLPQPLSDGDGFVANGYLYIMGGRSAASTCDATMLVASMSSNTAITNGNNPTGIGGWFETSQKYSGTRYGNAAVYSNGKAYILGGADCTAAIGGTYSTVGSTNYVVPQGVTSLTVKAWGAGGGGGAGGSGVAGAAGGAGGYASATISVTPGETLSLRVGGGGGGGGIVTAINVNGSGGGGGGYSGIFRGTTPLLIGAGGGGGAGARYTGAAPGVGGGGGGTTGVTGSAPASVTGGGGGTPTTGGTAGTGICSGGVGSSLSGGYGGYRAGIPCVGSGGGTAGTNGGGVGGDGDTSGNNSGGGGGGGGLFGGGGGGAGGTTGAGGGGGGSSMTTGTCGSPCNAAGSGTTPGNASDPDRGTAGNGGGAGAVSGNGSNGNNGVVVIQNQAVYQTPAVQQTALLAQPQVAQYSLKLDTDTDVYPSKWLINGTDNSIGAHWQLSYRSMTNPGATTQCATTGAMTNWGKLTSWGDVTLGTAGVYTPLDSIGTGTECARYFFLNTSVSAQSTYGYPFDSSRGPTISDLTLTFTADPSKRLLHGRTFVGGLGMPNDTSNGAN